MRLGLLGLLRVLTSIVCNLAISESLIIIQLPLVLKWNKVGLLFTGSIIFQILVIFISSDVLVRIHRDSIVSRDSLASSRRGFALTAITSAQADLLLIVHLKLPLVGDASSIDADEAFS